MLKRVLCVILCLVTLSSCAQQTSAPVTTEQGVTIQTFGTLGDTEPATTAPTENFDISLSTAPTATKPVKTDPPVSTAAPEPTDPPATEPPESSELPSVPDTENRQDYDITPISKEMCATSSVNVRERPDPDSKRVGHLDRGEKVTATGIVSNGWVRILFKGGEYYVNGGYLRESGGTATEQPASTAPEPTEVLTTSTAVTTTEPPATTPEPTTTLTTTEEPPEDVSEYIDETLNILTQPSRYTALNYSAQKAVWFAFLDLEPMLKNASESDFRARVSEAFDNVVGLGCNTVYVHVRSHGDAYYPSGYYPFTAAYSGTVGIAPDYDPLAVMITLAHERGLSFHAWINPMRTTSKEVFAQMPDHYTIKQWYNSDATKGTFMVYDKDTDFYWLSPAYPAVRELICNGVAEIVSRYDVDAIHIDDYFYPTTSSSFDKAAFEASGETDRAAWRRSVVNTLVREIYSTVKSCNSTVLFGVSPQGNVDNNLNKLYADVEMWCRTPGYLDYIVPQIYYGFGDKLSFDAAAGQWSEMTRLPGISLVCGIAAYKVGVNSEWKSGEILTKQTNHIKGLPNYSGVAYYRYDSFFGSASSSEKLMKTELITLRSAIKQY